MHLQCVTVDCADPERLAAFWSAALGWDAPMAPGDGSAATCRPPAGGPYLEFVRVPEPKAGKNRLHLGCNVGSLDRYDAELDRLVALGATVAWKEVFPPAVGGRYRNWILRDPEGNEFCLGGGTWPHGVPMLAEVPITVAEPPQ
jgi:catechol 2,3-dioxygenase-like lactoylglutathione lyase family enzyme